MVKQLKSQLKFGSYFKGLETVSTGLSTKGLKITVYIKDKIESWENFPHAKIFIENIVANIYNEYLCF